MDPKRLAHDLPSDLIRQTILSIAPGIGEIANRYFLRRMIDDPCAADWHVALSEIARWPKDAVIADIGCGPGTFLLYLRRCGYLNLVGTDHDLTKIGWAGQLLGRFSGPKVGLYHGHAAEPLIGMHVDVATAFGWVFERPGQLGDLLAMEAQCLIFSLHPREDPPRGTRVYYSNAVVAEMGASSGWHVSTTSTTESGMTTHVLRRARAL